LWIDNGHIKSTMINSPTTALGTNSGFSITSYSVVSGSNDVRGRIDIAFNATAITSYAYCEVKVQFNKLYSSTPFVTVSPMTELPDGVNYCISSITSSEFVLRIYKPNSLSITAGTYIIRFYYFVIE
ncbi:MAG: hypothetical protein N2203_02250, partial [Bacteroidia bacterium]|nr:hypothetical protein [Bacteroidia bacterium]